MTQAAPGLFDRWLTAASVIFCLQALMWAAIGSFDPFGIWDGLLADAFYDGVLPPEVVRFRRFVLGPFGATTAGYFFLVFMIARHPFRAREAWAFRAISGAVGLWFCVDTTVSLLHGALFNVLLVNIPALVLLATPLIALRAEFRFRA